MGLNFQGGSSHCANHYLNGLNSTGSKIVSFMFFVVRKNGLLQKKAALEWNPEQKVIKIALRKEKENGAFWFNCKQRQ